MTLRLPGKSIYGFPIFMLLLSLVAPLRGQHRDIGVGIGGLTYTGDLVRNYDFTRNRPAVQFYLRRNYSDVVSIRYSLTTGVISGDDDKPIDVLGQNRNASFSIFILEGAATLEYHFLNYKNSKSLLNWSPYFFAGFGVFRILGAEAKTDDYSSIQPVIPFGVGVKYNLDSRLSANLEFGPRKLFFDFLDNVSGGDKRLKNFQYGNEHDNDWYYFLGFTISYTLQSIPCIYNFY